MNVENIIRYLRALWRADKVIADVNLRHLLSKLFLSAAAAVVAGFGLLLFELAAYFALVQVWSAIASAAALGLFNFVIAAGLSLLAARKSAGSELNLAMEVHESAIEGLQFEARALQGSASGVLQHSLHGAFSGIIVPLLPMLVRSQQKTLTKSQSGAS